MSPAVNTEAQHLLRARPLPGYQHILDFEFPLCHGLSFESIVSKIFVPRFSKKNKPPQNITPPPGAISNDQI